MLTDTRIRTAKPREKPYKIYDDRGLLVIVNPNGSRWWRLKYFFGGKERGLSLGVYPDVSLKDARDRRDEARTLLAKGVDPSVHRQQVREARAHTFKIVAEDWLGMQAQKLSEATMAKARWMLESFVYPRLGSRPIGQITAAELLGVLRQIESRGTNETAHRTKQRCSQVLRYAVATGRAERDVTADLHGALAPVVTESHAAITEPAKIGALLRAIEGYDGHPTTARACLLVMVPTAEMLAAVLTSTMGGIWDTVAAPDVVVARSRSTGARLHNRGSTGSLSNARTPNTHSCTRLSG